MPFSNVMAVCICKARVCRPTCWLARVGGGDALAEVGDRGEDGSAGGGAGADSCPVAWLMDLTTRSSTSSRVSDMCRSIGCSATSMRAAG